MAKLIHEVKIISGLTDEMKAQGWKKVEPKDEKWAYEQSCQSERDARGYEAKHFMHLSLLAGEVAEILSRPQPDTKPDAAEALGAVHKLRDIATGHAKSWRDIDDIATCVHILKTALQNQGSGVPEGWLLVPREPTEEMIQILWEGLFTVKKYEDRLRDAYKTMIAAAPTPNAGLKEACEKMGRVANEGYTSEKIGDLTILHKKPTPNAGDKP